MVIKSAKKELNNLGAKVIWLSLPLGYFFTLRGAFAPLNFGGAV